MFGISAFSAAPFGSTGTLSVSVSLTGVSATGEVGSFVELNFSGTISGSPISTFPISSSSFLSSRVDVSVNVTGVQATGVLGDETVENEANVYLTGLHSGAR